MKTLLLIILLTATNVMADPHSRTYITEVTEVTNVTEVTTTEEQAAGVALAIALGQHQFDWGTDRLQGSISGGSYDDENAGSVAFGKRLKNTLVNISVGRVHGENAYGAAAGWRF